jgi:hypothetical protein
LGGADSRSTLDAHAGALQNAGGTGGCFQQIERATMLLASALFRR